MRPMSRMSNISLIFFFCNLGAAKKWGVFRTIVPCKYFCFASGFYILSLIVNYKLFDIFYTMFYLCFKDRLQNKLFITPSDSAFNFKCEMTYLPFF